MGMTWVSLGYDMGETWDMMLDGTCDEPPTISGTFLSSDVLMMTWDMMLDET